VPVTEGTVDGTVERRSTRLAAASGVLVVVVTVGAILAVRIFVAAHRPLSWAAAAIVAAVVLDPVVDRLAQHIRRLPAVLLCFVTVGVVVVGIAYLALDDIEEAVGRLEEAAPGAASDIEARDDRIGQLAREIDLTSRVDDFVAALDERFGTSGGEEVIRSTALTAPAYLAGAILTVFFMSYGPRLAHGAASLLRPGRQQRVAFVVGKATVRARHAGLLTIADAAVVGVLAGVVAWALDLPAPSALGLVAAVAALLPHLGIIVGWVPIIILALGVDSGPAALGVAALAAALQAVDSFLIRRRIDRSVRIGLLAPFVVLLLANAVYGVGAAFFGFAYAVFAMAVLDELAAEAPMGELGPGSAGGTAGGSAPVDG
jgi:predicted PurR-regulated permease PerM